MEIKRPVLEIPLSLPEKILQGVSATLLVASIVIPLLFLGSLPDRVPIHFGFLGEANAWGGRGSLFILPAVNLIFFAGLTLLERFPHIYNYVVEINQENAQFQYQNARSMVVWLKATILASFAYIEWGIVQVAVKGNGGIGMAFLPVNLLLLVGVIGYHIYRMMKGK